MHSTAAATLSYSTSLSMCPKGFWHCGHYILSYLTYNDLPEEGELEKQPQMENTSQSMWLPSFLFSSGHSHTCPTLCDGSRQHHTHSQSNRMCILDFYWAATDPSDLETKEHSSAFVQIQLPSSDCKSWVQGHVSLLLPGLQQRMLSAKVLHLPWLSCCKPQNCQMTSETASPGSHHQII